MKSSWLYQKRDKLSEIANNSYVGEIISIDSEDPTRVKINVYGIFSNNDFIVPTELLPWAYPFHSLSQNTNGSDQWMHPKVGNIVRVLFENDVYHPKYIATEELSQDVYSFLDSEGWEDSKVWAYDTSSKIKVYFTKNSGYVLEHDNTKIILDGRDMIMETAAYSVKLDEIMDILETLATGGNQTAMGPTGPNPQLLQKINMLKR